MPANLKLNVLIIDNYDSYTFNLYQYFGNTANTSVIRNDQFEWETFKDIAQQFDCLVISPGPGRPDHPKDFGLCARALNELEMPIFGVCLGHQGLGIECGAKVVRANPPMHGRISLVHHDGSELFKDIPSPFEVVRYHSLIVSQKNFPHNLKISGWTEDQDGNQIIMAMKHSQKPIWSVQFHPESICTAFGQQIVDNFLQLVLEHHKPHTTRSLDISVIPKPLALQQPSILELVIDSTPIQECESVFYHLYSKQEHSFWLDSAKLQPGLSRFSYMGDLSGPNSYSLSYSLESRLITRSQHGTIQTQETDSFFKHLATIMQQSKPSKTEWKTEQTQLPFVGGLVGYFGYEMKSESMEHTFATTAASEIPDAQFLFVDRVLVFDHDNNRLFLAVLVQDNLQQQLNWIQDTKEKLLNLAPVKIEIHKPETETRMKLAHNQAQYCKNIQTSLDNIGMGETYEVCLTTQMQCTIQDTVDPFAFYKHLRNRNPAPYGALLRLGQLSIASSSPERFLRIEDKGRITMKPIKGTLSVARAENFSSDPEQCRIENEKRVYALSHSEKDRAENLMIVDLIRNDLNLISEQGSVCVPRLMHVESYATVHQLVTTVESRLRHDLTAVDAVKAAFPPGSMTGAPKLRTCAIIEELEQIPRGIYSGCLGFFSVNSQSDFSVVIRTCVLVQQDENTKISIGAGGAIVALSDPQSEFDEMLLKANSVLPSLEAVLNVTHP